MLTRSRPIETSSMITRAIPIAASTWNAAEMTVEVVLSAGATVQRQDRRGTFDEVLDLNGAAIPDRLPLLDSHNRFELDGRLGEVIGIRLEVGQLVGTARLSKHSPLAQRIAAELSDGAKFGVSIGYDVPPGKWIERTDPKTQRRQKVATAFTVLEASLVAIPADPAATTRSLLMEPETDVIDAPAPQTRAQVNAEIRSIARTTGLNDAWANGQIDAEATLDQVRSAALAAMQERSRATQGIRTAVQVGEDHTDPVAIRTAMSDAMAHRLAPQRCTLEGRAVSYRGYRMLDMAAELANARGARVNPHDQSAVIDLIMRGGEHTTSDFSGLVADASNKVLLANYQVAQPTYRQWATRKNFTNWQPHNFLRIGDFPRFQRINEAGEVRYGTIPENREKIAAEEYGSAIKLSRKLLMSDDLGALADFTSLVAIRAAADEAILVYGLLTGAPVLSDGNPLFHASHGNLMTAAALSVTSVGVAVAALRKQRGLGDLVLNLTPRYLIVGPDLELSARQILATVTATKAGDINPWSGSMELIVDANITGNAWYISAGPELAPSIVYGFVNGAEGPQIRTEIDFETRGLKVAAGLDFGAGAIDYRGLLKNPGL